jgi:arsenate reductase (glutaredoxin)
LGQTGRGVVEKRRGMSKVEIWHNPRCSKSRAALELLKERGIEPQVVLYLEEAPARERIEAVLELLGVEPRELMRKAEEPFKKLNLGDPKRSRRELIDALAAHPILIERPIVIAGRRAVIGRPPERVLEIL